jgi:hypothetical protein
MTSLLLATAALQEAFSVNGETFSARGPIFSFSDGGFMMYPISFCAIMVLALTVRTAWSMNADEPGRGSLARGTIDGVLFWGGYAMVLGVLGTVVGIAISAQAVEAVGEVHTTLVWGGIKVSLMTTIFGLLVLQRHNLILTKRVVRVHVNMYHDLIYTFNLIIQTIDKYLIAEVDEYECPAGERLIYRFTTKEAGKDIRRYWSSACPHCPIKARCTTGPQRRISRWVHEDVLERVQARLDAQPDAMRIRRATVEHPFGTLKYWMGSTHFLTKTLDRVSTEMSLHVLAYNMKRVMNLIGPRNLLEAIQ